MFILTLLKVLRLHMGSAIDGIHLLMVQYKPGPRPKSIAQIKRAAFENPINRSHFLFENNTQAYKRGSLR